MLLRSRKWFFGPALPIFGPVLHPANSFCIFLFLPHAGGEELKRDILDFMGKHSTIAKYALPTDVAFVREIPHTATGKVSKLTLRQQFKDYKPAGQSKL